MDKKKSLLNVSVSVFFKIILLVASIWVKRVLINVCGDEINGLNSLYLSIIGFLSVAELGIGTSIVFCMYKPIVDGDNKKVSALYGLYKKLYLIICIIIIIAGLLITPFLKYLAKGYTNINENIYVTFLLMLLSVVLTYFYSSKTSLINAYKNNYITTLISSLGLIIQYGLQILVLYLTKSFVLYLVARSVAVIVQWLITEIVTRKKYKDIISINEKIDKETSNDVKKKVGAMFAHKIGDVLVNTADSIIISAFIGVAILGNYSNYTSISTCLTSVLILFFTPLSSVIGHLCVKVDKDEAKKYFDFFHTFNFILGCVFFLGYFAVIDEVVAFCFKENHIMAKSVSIVITINCFIQFMRQATLLFRDATGTFYYDRFKPIFEGIINIALSITLVLVLPNELKVVGVIIATIITNLFICHIIEPYVLNKYVFKQKPTNYYVKNYFFIIMFIAALFIFNLISYNNDNIFIQFLVKGIISVGISIVPCFIAILCSRNFREYMIKGLKKVLRK